MSNRQPTCSDLTLNGIFVVLIGNGILFSVFQGSYLPLIILIPLELLLLGGLYSGLRQGMRHPDSDFERYEEKVFLRALAFFILPPFIGVAGNFWIFNPASPALRLAWGAFWMVTWLGGSFWASSKVRSRHETSGGYKRRVGWRDPEK